MRQLPRSVATIARLMREEPGGVEGMQAAMLCDLDAMQRATAALGPGD